MERLIVWRALARGWKLDVVSLGLMAVAAAMLGAPALVFLPQLSSDTKVAAPTGALAGWACAILAVTTAVEPCRDVFVTSPRRAHAVNVLRVFVVAGIGTAVVAITSQRDLSVIAVTTATLTGEGLLAAALLGLRLAWLPPTLHVFASTFGATERTALAPWAWILAPEPTVTGACVSALILFVGAGAWWRSFHSARWSE